MIDQARALKVVSKLLPNMAPEKLKPMIAQFAAQHPTATDDQAFSAFVQALQHPNTQKKLGKNMGLQTYINNPLISPNRGA